MSSSPQTARAAGKEHCRSQKAEFRPVVHHQKIQGKPTAGDAKNENPSRFGRLRLLVCSNRLAASLSNARPKAITPQHANQKSEAKLAKMCMTVHATINRRTRHPSCCDRWVRWQKES
mmetsp:Transcript_51024/g.101939  ORF Transcript_51024/g.101939 Transcript_51024/m.101939 type:complete len:118 (-) Transcript_51024:288-641(-)